MAKAVISTSLIWTTSNFFSVDSCWYTVNTPPVDWRVMTRSSYFTPKWLHTSSTLLIHLTTDPVQSLQNDLQCKTAFHISQNSFLWNSSYSSCSIHLNCTPLSHSIHSYCMSLSHSIHTYCTSLSYSIRPYCSVHFFCKSISNFISVHHLF